MMIFSWTFPPSRQKTSLSIPQRCIGVVLGLGYLSGGVIAVISPVLAEAQSSSPLKPSSTPLSPPSPPSNTVAQPRERSLSMANPILKIGVVQRFGSRSADSLVFQAVPGDRLTLRYQEQGKPRMVSANRIQAEIKLQSLEKPILAEKVVLSSHRSFESAEDSANRWQAQGVEVEVGQPERWQVWAKRNVYNTPFLRQTLLKQIQASGNASAYIDTVSIRQTPQISWLVGTQRIMANQVEISAGKNQIWVTRSTSDRKQNLYPGQLRLQPNTYGTFTLINDVTVEDYLRGVVPYEIGFQAPRPAIEAQAILARTYALRNLRRFQIDNYELCADTQCQVYEGWKEPDAASDQAISRTRGQVLTYQNELIDALYFSTSGGVTAGFSDIWNGASRPYLQPVVDTAMPMWNLSQKSLADEANLRQFLNLNQGFNEAGWKNFRWQRLSSRAEITQDLKNYLNKNKKPLANLTQVQQVRITRRALSGRVQEIQVTTDVGEVRLEKDEIIQALSAPKSLLFYLKPTLNPDKTIQSYTFIGGGLGHGVGLSQAGSYNLGRLGWSYAKILQFYYPGTQLQPINPALTFWRPSLKGSP